jgi:hypothetical protein
MTNTIESLIKGIAPNAHIIVQERNSHFSGSYIQIIVAASDYEINRVKGQFPACVSLSLNPKTMDLGVQIYGGMGGNIIYRKPNMDDPSERYYAMKGIKIPFRRPKPNEASVLKTIAKFVENWKEAIKENLPVLCHNDAVDYEKAIS